MKHQNITFTAIALAIAAFEFLPQMQAVSPAPDGCYPNYTTAEGCNALGSLTSGAANTGLGWYSLFSDSIGNYSTAVGAGALVLNNADSNTAVGTVALFLNTSGTQNTAVGTGAMVYNDTGVDNTAVGAFALFSNSPGSFNTATGWQALYSNTSGGYNTATGGQALYSNTIGGFNTAFGDSALLSNTGGSQNTAIGLSALRNNDADKNTAVGFEALLTNTTGSQNTAIGLSALTNNNDDDNTAVGFAALYSNTTGRYNTAVGVGALYNSDTSYYNTAIGENALSNSTGVYNTGIGVSAGANVTSAGNVIVIGRIDAQNEDNSCFIDNIYNSYEGGPGISPVYVNGYGRLGIQGPSSSRRYKNEIQPMDKFSNALLALKPVTFKYKSDDKGTRQFGLIAEEVAKVNPDLIVRDEKGGIYSVRYDAVNAMLLNEFLKEHKKVQSQEATIAQLKKEMQNLVAQFKDQAAQIRKVSAQVEMSRPNPQVVNNR